MAEYNVKNLKVTRDGNIYNIKTGEEYVFDGTYNASTNKAATVSTVTTAINALDGNLNSTTPGAGKTLTAFSQTDGKVSATFGNISITKSQVSDLGTIGAAAAKGVDTSLAVTSTSTNVPTSAAVAGLVASLDGNLNSTTPGAGKTLTAFSQTDGKVSATFGNISITKSQVSDLGTIGAAAAKGVDTSLAVTSTSTNVPTSAAVAGLVASLDGALTGTPSTSKTLSAFSQADGKVTATFSNISIVKSQVSDLGTIGAAAAKGVDTSIAASSTSTNVPTSAAVAAFVENSNMNPLLMPSTTIDIPQVGSSDIYTMNGLTANHRVILWNFSASAENNAPATLVITTGANQFTITNNAGNTSETIQPVFSIANTAACTKQ